jgi:hypothetical protein
VWLFIDIPALGLDGTGPSPGTLAQVAMHHRLGVVGVCEASVVVVVSSAHRRAALVRLWAVAWHPKGLQPL